MDRIPNVANDMARRLDGWVLILLLEPEEDTLIL